MRHVSYSLLAASIVGILFSAAHAASLYSNGFEAGDPGTADFYDSTTGLQGQNIVAVSNGGGQLGLTALEGNHYAEVTNSVDTYQPGYGEATYTNYGRATNGPLSGTGILTGGAFTESAKYYINTTWAAPANPSVPALLIDTTPSTDPLYVDESNFQILLTGNGAIHISAAAGNPGTAGSNIAKITTSGWYTFETSFTNNGGFVQNTLSVISPGGTTIGSFTGTSTLPFALLTGTDYGEWDTAWQNGFGVATANGAANVIGIDDIHVTSTPEPASLGLLAAGAIGLLAKRRRRSA